MALTLNEFYIKRSGMGDFLRSLEENPRPPSISVYLSPGMAAGEISELASRAGVPALLDEITVAASGSQGGGVLFAGDEINCLVLPPFSPGENVVFSGCVTEPLKRALEKDYLVGLILVHLGSYAVGVCRGDSLVSSKVGTGLVHGRTRKGGSSSARFQRRRKNQAREFLERVCGHTLEHLSPYEKTLDYVLFGGPHHTVQQLQKLCPFLGKFKNRTLPVLEVPALRQNVLESAVTRLWSSRVMEWKE